MLKSTFALLILAAPSLFASPFSYNVTVNTSSLSATSGALYIQFNPGNATSDNATATISNFQITGPGSLTGAPVFSGSASGTLNAALAISNTASNNDALQALTFGNALAFRLSIAETFTGAANTGSVFNFGVFQSDGVTPLLTTQADGYSVIVNLDNRSGAAAISTTAAATVPAVSAVPEPATFALFSAGLAAFLFMLSRSKSPVSVAGAVREVCPPNRFADCVASPR